MDGMLFNPKSCLLLGLLAVLAMGGVGCQSAQPVSVRRLVNHQAMVDFSGLKSPEHYEVVKAEAAVPASWPAQAVKRGPMYTDMQWRSPSGSMAVGVAHVKMPLPLSSRGLLWFAKGHYAKQSDDGRVTGQWVDDLGRTWFEAETNKFRVRGFILTRGFEAWIVYNGFKTMVPTDVAELSLGARALETIVPAPNGRRSLASTPSD
jgi:hypothetical protein